MSSRIEVEAWEPKGIHFSSTTGEIEFTEPRGMLYVTIPPSLPEVYRIATLIASDPLTSDYQAFFENLFGHFGMICGLDPIPPIAHDPVIDQRYIPGFLGLFEQVEARRHRLVFIDEPARDSNIASSRGSRAI